MKTNEELNNESIQRTEKILSLLTEALSLIDSDAAMDASVPEHVTSAINTVKEDLEYYKQHGVEDLNKLDDEDNTDVSSIASAIAGSDFGRKL